MDVKSKKRPACDLLDEPGKKRHDLGTFLTALVKGVKDPKTEPERVAHFWLTSNLAPAHSGISAPESFKCPITYEQFVDPVLTSDGHTYERADIELWLSGRKTSPLTNLPLADTKLIPNRALKQHISSWHDQKALSLGKEEDGFELVKTFADFATKYKSWTQESRNFFTFAIRDAAAGELQRSVTWQDCLYRFCRLVCVAPAFWSVFASECGRIRHWQTERSLGQLGRLLPSGSLISLVHGWLGDSHLDHFEWELMIRLACRLIDRDGDDGIISALKRSNRVVALLPRMERMVGSVEASRQLTLKFHSKCPESKPLDVLVGISHDWPKTEKIASGVRWPPEVNLWCQRFKSFYRKQYSTRKIEWQLGLGNVELEIQFSSQVTFTALVSEYQAAILLMFNKKKILSFKDIREHTQQPDNILKMHFLALAHPQVRILSKKPNTSDLKDDHLFRLNSSFNPDQFKFRRVPTLRFAVRENKTPPDQRVRDHMIDCAIVAEMKCCHRPENKKSHAALLLNVMDRLKQRFSAEPTEIRRRIDSLIEREYIARDATDRNCYVYIP